MVCVFFFFAFFVPVYKNHRALFQIPIHEFTKDPSKLLGVVINYHRGVGGGY